MTKYTIGIDFGTDSCRALVVNTSNGEEISTAVANYPRWRKGWYCNPSKNQYRQHPLDYTEAMVSAVQKALQPLSKESRENIVGICCDTTGSTPVIIDAKGMPLALTSQFAENPNAMFILWKDHTAVAEADQINVLAKEWPVNYAMYEGGTYSSEWAWAKVLHILKTDPEVASAAYSWAEHCDWMAGLLTGNCTPETMPRSRCAAGHKAMWNAEWGLPSVDFLSKLHPKLAELRNHLYTDTITADTKVGTITKEWAEKLGVPETTVVASGAIDAHLGAVGSGISEGILARIIGTSTCDIMVVSPATINSKCIDGICGQVDGSVIPGYIGLEAGQSAFGDIYAWFRDIVAWPLKNMIPDSAEKEQVIDNMINKLMEEAAKTEPSENSIIALDWMNGRRTPHANQNLKGMITGLTLGSNAPMIMRALVEATAFGSKRIADHFEKEGIRINSIIATGGISKKAPFVMQTMADVMDMPIKVIRSGQTCALGAAMCAAVAAGIYSTVSEAQKAMAPDIEATYAPDPTKRSIYKSLYEKYLKLGEFEQDLQST